MQARALDRLPSWAQLASVDVCEKLAPAVAAAFLLWLVRAQLSSKGTCGIILCSCLSASYELPTVSSTLTCQNTVAGSDNVLHFVQVTHRVRSPWALPAVLLAMPAIFFAILYGPAGSDLAAARAEGWVQNQVRVSAAVRFLQQ